MTTAKLNDLASVFFLLATWQVPAFAKTNDGAGLVIVGGLAVAIGAAWAYSKAVNSGVQRKMAKLSTDIAAKERSERAVTAQAAEAERKANTELFERQARELDAMDAAFKTNFVTGRRWLAQFIAEAYEAPDLVLARALETKKNPAVKTAEEVRRISREKKALVVALKEAEYTIATYHDLFPVLEQYREDILNDKATLTLADNDDSADAVANFISREEYDRLSPVERNQLALTKWLARPKSTVDIGRMYERYIGHLYEVDGWTVSFFGATQGMEDLGRDLICVKAHQMHVVQAKYWAKHKTIHEKHIFQLYGTTVLMPLVKPDLRNMTVKPVFTATTKLSPTAEFAAEQLGVEVRSLEMSRNYPLIKCNINGKSKIYHLPFDQQYDRVRIDLTKGERYVSTTQEAEKFGFRRAMRHTTQA